MSVVAGVDFGTLSVRVSIVDSERGLGVVTDSPCCPSFPLDPQIRR